jgi:hypothetical protein
MHAEAQQDPNNLPAFAEPRMTAAERTELKTLVNERARLAIDRVKSLAADRLVELNKQLEARWAVEDFEIGELDKELRRLADEANGMVQARCDELGIHRDLRPRASYYFGRVPVDPTRRAQLRQMAKDENAAAVARAVHQINTWKINTRTELVRDGLTSTAATAFLDSLPVATELLPEISAHDITKALDAKRGKL